MTDLDARLNNITKQDMENPRIADLIRNINDPLEYSDIAEREAYEQINDHLMDLAEEEKARQKPSSCNLPKTNKSAAMGIIPSAQIPKCDLFNSVSNIEIQKDKQVAGLHLPPADAEEKGSAQLDSKQVTLTGDLAAQGNEDEQGKQVASANTAPLASTRAIMGDIVWMQTQLWDNSDRNRCVKYYSKYSIKLRRQSGKIQTRTLYLNFTRHRSFVKNYKTILTDRQEWEKPVEQFYDMWRKRSLEIQKEVVTTREPLIGIAMSDPKSIASIDRGKDGKEKPRLRFPTKKGKEVRNEYWPGHVGILYWDEYDNPHIWLGFYDHGEWLFSLIDGKHAADFEPKTETQKRYGHRPCDYLGYWHQDNAQQEFMLEKAKRLRRNQI